MFDSVAPPVPVIQARGLFKRYDVGGEQLVALSDVGFDVDHGEYVAIVGSSGSGKSTLMNVLGCLDQASSGSYFLNDLDVDSLSERELATLRSREIGFIFQNFSLMARETAIRNVMRPLVYRGVPRDQRHAMAERALDQVQLGHRAGHLPAQLSGGQRQRVAIARALCSNPSLIIADEPTGNLDSHATSEILGLFQALNQAGATILLVTHDADVAARSSRIITMLDGKVVSDRRC